MKGFMDWMNNENDTAKWGENFPSHPDWWENAIGLCDVASKDGNWLVVKNLRIKNSKGDEEFSLRDQTGNHDAIHMDRTELTLGHWDDSSLGIKIKTHLIIKYGSIGIDHGSIFIHDDTQSIYMNGKNIYDIFSAKEHIHDERYSLTSHNHDERYSLASHNHDNYLQIETSDETNTVRIYDNANSVQIYTADAVAKTVQSNISDVQLQIDSLTDKVNELLLSLKAMEDNQRILFKLVDLYTEINNIKTSLSNIENRVLALENYKSNVDAVDEMLVELDAVVKSNSDSITEIQTRIAALEPPAEPQPVEGEDAEPEP